MKRENRKVLSRQIKIPDLEKVQRLITDIAPAASRLGLRVYIVGGAVRDLVEGNALAGESDLVVLGNGPVRGQQGVRMGSRKLAQALSAKWKWREPVAFDRYGTYLVSGPAGSVEISQGEFRTGLRNLA